MSSMETKAIVSVQQTIPHKASPIYGFVPRIIIQNILFLEQAATFRPRHDT